MTPTQWRRSHLTAKSVPFTYTTNHCGSEPARESGVSFNLMSTDTPHSRAGSLPQVLRLILDQTYCAAA
ncbi:hypothetical protein C1894_20455 [Pseudomonas sp. FW305-3-2-15-E-TSA2]|nr:hypothetical protein C1895_22800 [Pseudomonas sp. FW305-3-2-15-E-TSA4]POA38877.1 hypothetical protein C1894_20455 [Pseudomonas sp. FW305-3-2-15-E-TSA2]